MRLIDIEPFETEKNVVCCEIYRHFIGEIYGAVQTTSTASIPTVDAVPVVRCKDCKHCLIDNKRGDGLCMRIVYRERKRLDDFCSYGERGADNG